MGKKTNQTKTNQTNTMSSPSEEQIVDEIEIDVDEGPAVSEQVTTVDTVTDIINRIELIQNNFKNEIKTILSDLKSVRKVVTKLEKKKNRKRVVDPNKPRAPSGITRPTKISEELRTFLGLPEGEMIARTVVTTKVNAYVKANNLQNPENGQQILLEGEAGERLRKLLNPTKPLTFFNLQTYLAVHFVKPVESEAPKKATEEKTEEKTESVAEEKTDSTKVRTARRVRKTRKDLEEAVVN